MKKILITGGGGYVGSQLTQSLLDKGYEVTVLDLFIYGEDVLKKDKNLLVVKGDIRDEKLLTDITHEKDVLIHLACISNDPSFELNPKLGKSINFDAFEPIVSISKKNNIKRFIYASSSSVYGLKDENDVSEDMSLEPLTDYSKFKADCEKILNKYNSASFTTTSIRPATVCGYSPRQRFDLVVNILTNLAYINKVITVFGGEQLRPNIHIQDMIRAYEMIIEAPKEKISGAIFNVGFENMKVKHLANLVKKIIGDDVKIEFKKTDDNRSYHISSKKIKNILGFEPKFTVEDAIKDLKDALEKGKLPNSLNEENYFNIKKMQKIKLN